MTAESQREKDLKIKIGSKLAKQIPSVRSAATVSKELGVSRQAIKQTEALALFKLFAWALELQEQEVQGLCNSPVE